MVKNYFIVRLHLLMLSPTFSSLLTFILLIFYKIYFDPAILCDEGDSVPLVLDQLKENLREEMRRSSYITSRILEVFDTVQEIKRINGEITPAQNTYYKDMAED
jgi:hypothetical protein